MTRNRWMLPAMALAAAATMVCAHLPSMYDARFQIDKERELKGKAVLQQREKRGLRAFQSAATWDKTKKYAGDYTIYQGDTVKWQTDRYGRDLYWWSKFYADGDEPGGLGEGGGTSPWVLINSLSMAKDGRVNYQWSGWDGSAPSTPKVATWRNGAKGAYSFTHDDIGTMPFGRAVFPAYDLSQEAGFEEIKTSWGVFVREMIESDDWNNAIAMVKDGHEMFNHSWDHTSAADQYQWFYPTTTIPDFDPSIPYEIRGLKVVGLWGDPTKAFDWKTEEANFVLTLENDLVKVTGKGRGESGPVYWTQKSFKSGTTNITIETKSGVEKIKVNDKDLYVKYSKKDPKLGTSSLNADGSSEVKNEGFIAAVDPGWFDLDQLDKYGENGWNSGVKDEGENWWVNPKDVAPGSMCPDWTDGGKDPSGNCSGAWPCNAKKPCQADNGTPGMLVKVFTVNKWSREEFKKNIDEANKKINEEIYNKITNPGKYFAQGKKCEYFGYPFDAYSLQTHDSLFKYDIYQARGGSKTPQVMKGDFFHPYAIDFDAFYITKTDWTAEKGGKGWVYPDNPHVWLGLNQMVDSIIHYKGYMIREFHAVADIKDGEWYKDAQGRTGQESNSWVLNSPAAGKGGWWGGITKDQLRVHYRYLKQKIEAGDLVVFTPSEAVKYRMTANATSNPQLSKDGNNYKLSATTTTDGIETQQQDEISIIVGIDATNDLDVQYTSGGQRPRLAPKKLNSNGSAWAVNFNPFKGEVKLIRGQKFEDPKWDGPDVNVEVDPGGDDCNPLYETCSNAILAKTGVKKGGVAFNGIRNGQIQLNLNAGNYTAELYNLQGRLIARSHVTAENGVNPSGLKTNNLSRGMFILNVKQAGVSVLRDKVMIK